MNAPAAQSSEPTFTPGGQAQNTAAPTNTVVAALPTDSPTSAVPQDPTKLALERSEGFNVVVSVDTTKRHPISPLIYGVADPTAGDEDVLRWLGIGLLRWGGNARDMHNWEINASNAGSDYEFRNVSQGDGAPGSASLNFLQRNDRLGAGSILTIPTIGWVAKNGDENTRSVGVPEHGGPAISKGADTAFTVFSDNVWTKPYDPTANRKRTSVQSLPTKGGPYSYPPDLKDGKVYQDEWVAYLREASQAPKPKGKYPTIYAMDNEPELWADSTHVDVRPVRLGYDDELQNFLTYARAVKHADPDGLVAGPESWGVTGYLFSALDEGGDQFATAADRKAHGNIPWLQWFLKSVADSDKAAGSRSLDVLTVHYYPNAGQYKGDNSPDMQKKRVDAPRALWDGLYVEPSWVAGTEWGNLALLRRLKQLIERNYPGTKLGITEWNFGGEDDISGAIATADALGIFGQEDVYVASYWGLPKQNSPTGWAFRLYGNYDGNGSSFGTESVAVDSKSQVFSAYGALNGEGKRLTLMLINKDLKRTATAQVKAGAFAQPGAATLYRYSKADLSKPSKEEVSPASQGSFSITLPPLSIGLLVLDQ